MTTKTQPGLMSSGHKTAMNMSEINITDIAQEEMLMFLDPRTDFELVESKKFKKYLNQLDEINQTSDYITFVEVVTGIRDHELEKDASFSREGEELFLKVLYCGSPSYMANEGIVLLATAFVYPQQFMTREYHPDPPEEAEEEDYFYPEVALVMELYAFDDIAVQSGSVYWDEFEGAFPENTYISKDERLDFEGSWDQCVKHYVKLVRRMQKLGKKDLKASKKERTRF